MVAILFLEYSFNVVIAFSGNEVIKSLKKDHDFDAIISDLKMSDGNGLDLLLFVNDYYQDQKRTRFIFVSGESDISEMECLDQGVNEFFLKPFRVDQIIESLDKYL